MNRSVRPAAILLCATLLAIASVSQALESIPPGTILPVMLNSTISSAKSKPGQIITARIMQDVPLPNGQKIRAGATVIGHVTRVTSTSGGGRASVAFRFDTLKVSHQEIPIATNLRALASFVEVEQAQIPLTGPDRGTSQDALTTTQIGGEAVYRGGGPVQGAFGKVGKPVPGGVLSRLNPNPERGCRDPIDATEVPQPLWVFSSDACGTYGLPHLEIVHAGRTNPIGEIILESTKGEMNVRSGAGVLLRLDSADLAAQAPE
jgi:hypothetical protein